MPKIRVVRFSKRLLLSCDVPPPKKRGGFALSAPLYFGQVFTIFVALAPPDGMFLRSSERHYSANGGGSI